MHLGTFYDTAVASCEDRLRVIRRKSNGVSLLRLTLFAGLVISVYSLFKEWSIPLLVLSVVLAAGFIGCVNWYFRLKDERALWEKLLFVNSNEREVLADQANGFPDGIGFLDPENYLDDLDIFGKASVFHTLNRTTTSHGTAALAALLQKSPLSAAEIVERQAAVKSLAGQADLRRLLVANGLLSTGKKGDLYNLGEWVNRKPDLFGRKVLRIVIGVLTIGNLAAVLYFLSSGDYYPVVAGILICRLMTGYFSKAVSREHQLISYKHDILEQYAAILAVFCNVDAGTSPVLQQLQMRAKAAHTAIRQLSKLAGFFEQQHNLLVNIFLNSLIFYDLQCMIALERWKGRYKAGFPTWIEAVGSIECFNSLATFAFNHPGYAYPVPVGTGGASSGGSPGTDTDNSLFLEASELAHPLIPAHRRIANDFSIGRNERLILVSGSNMSGKTTFLRTLGVNLLLAQIGAPVCASSFVFTPMQLLTSLRISDSLQEQTSYFMAELKKLQRIVRQLETGVPALVLIDEILRGTNSEDKTYGSEQFARKLTRYDCLSLFATHDLTLGQLEHELPGVVANYCFESVIEDGDLHFNYRLQRGIARNRNASFLMKKMDII
jgi:hypothetical protein